jgi:ribosomal protein S18 acetylase RimI-like enzyme
MLKKQIPNIWETERIWVTDSMLDEVEELGQINDAVPQTRGWTHDGMGDKEQDHMLSALTEGVVPPKGSKEFFRLQSIRKKDSEELMGFIGMYHGFPRAGVLWITTLTLHPRFQGKGYGPELLTGLSEIIGQLGYSHVCSYVSLTNWPSLRLCVKVGMDKMIRIEGDKVYSDGAEAHVMLEKDLQV